MTSRVSISLLAILATTAALALGVGLVAVTGADHWIAVAIAYGAVGLILFATALLHSGLRRMEEEGANVQAIVQRAADGIITADENGTIEFVNLATERIFGYRASELEGCAVTVLLSSAYPEQEDGDFWDFLRVNAIQATGTAHEVIGLRKGGEKFFMDLSISEAHVGQHAVFVAIVRDVTERKKAQISLRNARDDLEIRVEERTADLQDANEKLQTEILEHERSEAAREKLVDELRGALSEIKTLSGLIPICASCKKVRDDQGYWNQIEVFVRDRSDAEFSHSICPDCVEKLYPDL